MKIVKLTAENVKRLSAVEIIPGEKTIVEVAGPNSSGKSSVLDAIFYALAGASGHPSQPIRKGAKSASVVLDLGELIVTRKFTAGGTTLVVESKDRLKHPTPQAILDKLVGTLTFDPLEFARQEPAQQLEVIRRMVKFDVDLNLLDAKNQRDFDKRTEINREAKRLTARVAPLQVPESPLPDRPVNVEDLLMELKSIEQHNRDVETARRKRKETEDLLVSLRGQRDALNERIAKGEKFLADQPKIAENRDDTVVRHEIAQAGEVNRAIEKQNERVAMQKDIDDLNATSEGLTSDMENRTEMKRAAIQNAKMPIPGLSFGETEVLYNGLPLAQAGAAEQLRVSVAIAMAANPKLKILRIKDGSLLDKNGLEMLRTMAGEQEYQIWLERVEPGENVSVVMEDGHVRKR